MVAVADQDVERHQTLGDQGGVGRALQSTVGLADRVVQEAGGQADQLGIAVEALAGGETPTHEALDEIGGARPVLDPGERAVLTPEEAPAVEQDQAEELGLATRVAPPFQGDDAGMVVHRESSPERKSGLNGRGATPPLEVPARERPWALYIVNPAWRLADSWPAVVVVRRQLQIDLACARLRRCRIRSGGLGTAGDRRRRGCLRRGRVRGDETGWRQSCRPATRRATRRGGVSVRRRGGRARTVPPSFRMRCSSARYMR